MFIGLCVCPEDSETSMRNRIDSPSFLYWGVSSLTKKLTSNKIYCFLCQWNVLKMSESVLWTLEFVLVHVWHTDASWSWESGRDHWNVLSESFSDKMRYLNIIFLILVLEVRFCSLRHFLKIIRRQCQTGVHDNFQFFTGNFRKVNW